MQSCTSRLCDFKFDKAAIARSAAGNRLLTMEIEFNLRCKFRCPHCYVPEQSSFVTGNYLASDPMCRRNCRNES